MTGQDPAGTTPPATTSTSTTSTTSTATYVVQHLNERYIRSRVLDDYINARLDEFGSQWSRTTIRDHHTIIVARQLTPAEIADIQEKSYPGYFAQSHYWRD